MEEKIEQLDTLIAVEIRNQRKVERKTYLTPKIQPNEIN